MFTHLEPNARTMCRSPRHIILVSVFTHSEPGTHTMCGVPIGKTTQTTLCLRRIIRVSMFTHLEPGTHTMCRGPIGKKLAWIVLCPGHIIHVSMSILLRSPPSKKKDSLANHKHLQNDHTKNIYPKHIQNQSILNLFWSILGGSTGWIHLQIITSAGY